jgi:hypothetical protein
MFGCWQQQSDDLIPRRFDRSHRFPVQGKCYVWKINDEKSSLPRYQAVTKFAAHKKYLTRVLLSPDVKSVDFAAKLFRFVNW